ncbi:putative toxin-antitoxin system toxin component, PIN family [Parabacteroides sp. PF5-6]|uniref:putative toxin-antitoxin system toxin component, PIN family n=1 Tax=Parabacteroides sp. PF5-6 TaxID=1742403 RepID=UPI002405D186|nr:putative toxin-antitoxin system toxin component, PIN family [Parabacteroides sp. PF5-6]MDF9828938.1 putative PIN family toxin of toxin-antitoxin system [Parabacteroides sp. PF5-6]
MSRIVLDTNSLIQSLPPRSKYHRIWESFLDGTNQLCISVEILNEYEEILERLAGIQVAKLTIELIINNPHTLFFSPHFHFELIEADPDDNKFVDCAIVANAKFIVTEDKHFNILKQYSFPKVDIIGLDDFLSFLLC